MASFLVVIYEFDQTQRYKGVHPDNTVRLHQSLGGTSPWVVPVPGWHQSVGGYAFNNSSE